MNNIFFVAIDVPITLWVNMLLHNYCIATESALQRSIATLQDTVDIDNKSRMTQCMYMQI